METEELDLEMAQAEAAFEQSRQRLEALRTKKLQYLQQRMIAAEEALQTLQQAASQGAPRTKAPPMSHSEAVENVFSSIPEALRLLAQ